MEYKLIHTENYLLVVDEDVTQAKEDAWITRNNIDPVLCDANFFFDFKEPYKKVINHIPLNNSPILEGVDLLPPLEDDVEKLADEQFESGKIHEYELGFIKGYNKAKETYKYTEEDVIKAIEMSKDIKYITFSLDEIIQSLQQPRLPTSFECEMVVLRERPTDLRNHIYDKTYEVPKTFTMDGITLWSGKYVY